MADVTRKELRDRLRPNDRLIVGNWLDPDLLVNETFDVVLADYLLGAVDGFAPYWQDQLLPRLRTHVGRRLYLIGLEPYVPHVPSDPDGRLVNEIGRLRDACLLLSGDRPYREYPMHWVLRHLELAKFRVVDAQTFPIHYRERFVISQLDLCSQALDRLKDRSVAVAMLAHVAALRDRALAFLGREGAIRHGNDYIVVAEPL